MVREKDLMRRERVEGSGVYCFFPFDTLDEKGYGVFKIGMTSHFHNRIGSYHTYLPEGIYFVAFLKNPTKLKGDMNLATYYVMIEKEIFNDIKEHGGRVITQAIRYNNEGETEWIYCNQKQIDDAFERAYVKYGGKHSDLETVKGSFKRSLAARKVGLEARKIFKGEIYFV